MPQKSINGRAGMLIGFFEGAENRGGKRSVMMVPASFKLLLMDACQLPRQLLQAVDSGVCRRKLSRTGVLDLLSATPPADGADAASLAPQWDRLWTLYSLVRRKRPSLVLEYGSGYSTAAMAEALKENGSGKLVSFETSAEWSRITEQRLGCGSAAYVELVLCSPEIKTLKGFFDTRPMPWARLRERHSLVWSGDRRPVEVGVMGFVYREAEQFTPDLILIDGPSGKRNKDYVDSYGSHPPTIVFDPLMQEHRYRSGAHIVLDSRLANSRFLVNNLKRDWRYRPDSIRRQNHLSLFD
jgi:hypothetical protein